jgi:hypothetical protein
MIWKRETGHSFLSSGTASPTRHAALGAGDREFFNRLPHGGLDRVDVAGIGGALSQPSQRALLIAVAAVLILSGSLIAFIGIFDRGYRRDYVLRAWLLLMIDYLALGLLSVPG